jgi:hypothetical protein
MGDSASDSYRANDNRGGAYRPVTFNWLELLVRTGRVDAGPWGSFTEPRRIDYARNWARSGATVTTLLSRYQHTGLAAQVAPEGVEFAVLWIGANDFHPNSGYRDVYTGTVSGAALQRKIDRMIAYTRTAAETVRNAGTNILILPVADYGYQPAMILRYPDPVKRARVSNAIAAVNAGVQQHFAGQPSVVVVSMAESLSIYAQPLVVDGVTMNCAAQGDHPSYCVLADGHAGTVLNGLLANLIIGKVNAAFGLGIMPLTQLEILQQAGLR